MGEITQRALWFICIGGVQDKIINIINHNGVFR